MLLEQSTEAVGVTPNNTLGVTNHLTPIENIVTNVRNLFGSRLGWVISIGEDGVSLKITCSRFTSKERVTSELYNTIDSLSSYGTSISQYLCDCGLCGNKMINTGREYVVYFYPTDIKTVDVNKTPCDCDKSASNCCCDDKCCCPCKEMLDNNIEESELMYIKEDNDDEEELEDLLSKEIEEIIEDKDKIKASKAFAEKLKGIVSLPEGYYFCGVKDKNGHESIALRHKYEKRRPFGETVQIVKSLMNIYGKGKDAIWIPDWDDQHIIKDEDKNLITTILTWLKAGETKDECVWYIGELSEEDAKKVKKETPKKPKVKWVLRTEDGEDINSFDKQSSAIEAAQKYNSEHEDSPVVVHEITDDEKKIKK